MKKLPSPVSYVKTIIRRIVSPTLKEHEDLSIPDLIDLHLEAILALVKKERPGILQYGFGQWIQAVARGMFKHGDDENDNPEQLEMEDLLLRGIPPVAAQLMLDLGMKRVFDPERNAFVEVVALGKGQAKRCGDYLIQKGEDCIANGKILIQLDRFLK